MWRCGKCNVEHPDTLGICVNCGYVKDGIPELEVEMADDPTAIREGIPEITPEHDELYVDASRQCPKCHSADIIWNARTWGYRGTATHVAVHEYPGALIMKGTEFGELKACICGQCGFTEFYVSNHRALFKAYRKSDELQ